ncbi:MAG: CHASE2 domain-containing protein [Rudaea sp.]
MTGATPGIFESTTSRLHPVGAALLAALAAALALGWASRLPLQAAWFDALQRLAPRSVDSLPVTIVGIDDASLAALGRWPWPRTMLARLVRTIDAARPAAIGLDIVMPEADPLSPGRLLANLDADPVLAARVAALPSNDEVLARELRAAPTVMAVVGAPDGTHAPLRAAPVLVRDARGDSNSIARARARLPRYPSALSSLPLLNDAAHGWGLITVEDPQAILRSFPLVANVAGTLVPSLAMEMWRVALDTRVVRLATRDGAAESVTVRNRTFRTDVDGSVRVYFSPRVGDRFVSAKDVLDGKVDPDRFRGVFALVGVTALAEGDYVWTPLGIKMPGVEVHAQLLENMRDGQFLVRPSWASHVEAAALAVAGLLLIVLAARGWTFVVALAALGGTLSFFAAAYASFRAGRWLLDAATPSVALWLLFGVLTAVMLVEATRQRRALQLVLQREREEAARVAGELQAARRIQLDTLPRAERFSDPRIELAASMEPAQEVGGDLYDFYLLDERRLFFMLGDVSGKGLSASIFMAVSKALCKSTMLRAANADLGALLSQANVEVARDNPAAFFVTVFAGVLDLGTGELHYCNAGHENPWRVQPGGGTGRLVAGGGPPLCVLDDFEYRAARTRLASGEIVCIVSDGVTEAADPAGELYGTARVDAALGRAASAHGVVETLRADVAAFARDAPQSDDMTVLALRFRGS